MPDGFLKLGVARRSLGIPVLPLSRSSRCSSSASCCGRFRSGRELYAIGSNPDAATLAGIRVERRVLGAFVVCGALAGLAGVLYAARFGTVDAAAGTGIELAVVAAVVVGGVAIFGGSGTSTARRSARCCWRTISSALVILQVNPFWEQAINGALLLLVAIDASTGCSRCA